MLPERIMTVMKQLMNRFMIRNGQIFVMHSRFKLNSVVPEQTVSGIL